MALFGRKKQKLARAGSDDERLVQLIVARGCETVVDVGANVGQYARRLRAAGWHGPIVSVEPTPASHAALAAAAADDPLWTVAPAMALGEADGTATLHLNVRSDMNSLSPAAPALAEAFPRASAAGTVEVPVRRLDAIFDELASGATRAFVKIDVQGFEAQVLAGAEGALARIEGLQLELPVSRLYAEDRYYLDTLNRLDELGYELAFVFDLYFSRALGRQVKFDGVFFRRDG
jgi:FkbM family methyltransferase